MTSDINMSGTTVPFSYSFKRKFDVEKYMQFFNDNYYGRSDQAKELEDILKIKKRKTSSGTIDYIPWGIALRMVKQQDPEFEYEKMRNDDTNSPLHGTLLWYNGRPDQDDANYFVKVKTIFFGNEVIEDYPCQDFDFQPVSFGGRKHTTYSGKALEIKLDANITNKALQRALTKSIAINTGIGLALYEGLDLQFESDAEDEGVPVEKETKPKATKSAPVKVSTDVATEYQLNELKRLADKSEENKNRIKKALSSYKKIKVSDLTKSQSDTIIKALGGQLENEITRD